MTEQAIEHAQTCAEMQEQIWRAGSTCEPATDRPSVHDTGGEPRQYDDLVVSGGLAQSFALVLSRKGALGRTICLLETNFSSLWRDVQRLFLTCPKFCKVQVRQRRVVSPILKGNGSEQTGRSTGILSRD